MPYFGDFFLFFMIFASFFTRILVEKVVEFGHICAQKNE